MIARVWEWWQRHGPWRWLQDDLRARREREEEAAARLRYIQMRLRLSQRR